MANPLTLLDKYPDAFEDDNGTIWTSLQAAENADFEVGDESLDEILGWSWQDAEENFALTQRIAKRKAFWTAHPRLRATWWFLYCWYGALSLFAHTVGREWYGVRLGPALTWQLAKDVWLAPGRDAR